MRDGVFVRKNGRGLSNSAAAVPRPTFSLAREIDTFLLTYSCAGGYPWPSHARKGICRTEVSQLPPCAAGAKDLVHGSSGSLHLLAPISKVLAETRHDLPGLGRGCIVILRCAPA